MNTSVDLLDEDRPIAGQKFVCVSFVSPEKHIKQRELYYFEQFVKNWDMAKSINKFQSFLNFIGYKHNLDIETINSDLKDFLKEESKDMIDFTVHDDFKTFLDNKQDDLDKEYNVAHKFQTNVRGMKVRGVYSTQEEAEMRSGWANIWLTSSTCSFHSVSSEVASITSTMEPLTWTRAIVVDDEHPATMLRPRPHTLWWWKHLPMPSLRGIEWPHKLRVRYRVSSWQVLMSWSSS